MDNRKLFETLDDETARMDRVLLLSGMAAGCMSDDLRDFFLEEDYEKIIGVNFDELANEAIEAEDFDELSSWLLNHDILGVIVSFCTPVMDPHSNGASYSWGHMRSKWVYANDIDEAVKKGLAWVADVRQREIDKKAKA